ncbi:hypothetical protein NIA69_05380 [Gemmiger formicilis]|nr:hypothetical protein [Gemmiger formicilis]
MKRGLDFIADQQNEITEKNLHQLYQISTESICRQRTNCCRIILPP